MNNEEQIKVLQMVANGIVSIEEGEDLLDALERPAIMDTTPFVEEKEGSGDNKKWLRYRVIDEKSGVESVNLRLPSRIFSGWFTHKGKLGNRFKEATLDEIEKEKQTEHTGMFLDILGEDDGKRFKLYFE